MKIKWLFTVAIAALFSISSGGLVADSGKKVKIELTQPELSANPYHRPYVAVWVETLEREPVATVAVWHEQDKWLKDLRQWWRKIGRQGQGLDGRTGATVKPGQYTLFWDGKDSKGKDMPEGKYLLNVEAAREEGGRSYLRETITLGTPVTTTLAAEPEIGPVTLQTF